MKSLQCAPFLALKAAERLQLATLLAEPEQAITLPIDLEAVCPQVVAAQPFLQAVLAGSNFRQIYSAALNLRTP
jgi:hypothetical protein